MSSPSQDAFSSDQILSKISTIRATHPGNLMARHFDADYFNALDQSKRDRLVGIIRTGIENPDSQMGAYARHAGDYEDFNPLFEPMIRDQHNIPQDQKIVQNHDWSAASATCNLEDIDAALKNVSMRVRVGRNLADFPLPGAMTKQHRLDFEASMIPAFKALQDDPLYGGQYLSLTPGSAYLIEENAYQRRIAAHQMFKDMDSDPYLNSAGISSDWPYGRGMYISGAEDFMIWVGEEDQLRIMAIKSGGDLAALFSRLHDGLQKFTDLLPPFAQSPRYGYVTSCPTNLGTAMRASLHLPLPNLTQGGRNLGPAQEAASGLGLAVRGVGGEHSDAGEGGIIDISPRARLGITESGVMQCLYDGAAALWSLENTG